jgi:hypothetical protein
MALCLAVSLELDYGPTIPLVGVSRNSLSQLFHPVGILFDDISRKPRVSGTLPSSTSWDLEGSSEEESS